MPPRVAVLGAGTMAPGIAAAFAAAGHEVLLWSRRPERTAAALARAAELARFLAEPDLAGKQPVRLEREVLGFLGTRLQQAVVREAIALLEAGAASAEDIDRAVRTSFGIRFPVIGPLESADLSGLDVIEAIHRYLLPDLDRSTEPQQALTQRVAAGALGT